MTRTHINPPLSLYKKIAFTFIVLSAALVAVIFYFAVSYAYITVYPKTEPVKSDFSFSIVSDAQKADPTKGIFPGAVIDQQVEGSGTFPTKGTLQLLQGTVGKVVIKNTYSKDQPLIATTRLITKDGVLYRIKNKVVAPAGGSVETEIYADNPAKAGAITKGTRFTIPGLFEGLQDKIYAESSGDFTGESKTVKAVTDQDITDAVNAIMETEMGKLLKDQEGLSRILKTDIVSQQWSAKVGDQVDSFTGTVKLRVTGVVFNESPVHAYGTQVLEQLVPVGKQLLSTDKVLTYELQKQDSDTTVALVKGTASGVAGISADNEILNKSKFLRLKPAILKAYLENFDSIEHVELSFFPSWNKVVPRFEDHILIRIAQ